MQLHNMMCRKLSAMGVKKDLTLSIVNLVDKWVNSSGPEWTVLRLKDLKQVYVHHLSGNQPKFHWVAHVNGLPLGPFGQLMKTGCNLRQRRKHIAKVWFTLNMYTTYISGTITDRQARKFFDGVTNPPESDQSVSFSIVRNFAFTSSSSKYRAKIATSMKRHQEKSSRLATFDDLPWGNTSVPVGTGERRKEHDTMSWLPSNAKYIVSKGWSHMPSFEGMGGHEELLKLSKLTNFEPTTIGAIGFIQEPGFKLRSVANPNRLIQTALKPLQQSLFGLLRSIPADCTFDQQKGVDFASEALKEGKTVNSIDLSSATDHFPLELQLSLMRKLSFDKDAIQLFELASRDSWEIRDPRLPSFQASVQWTFSQGMESMDPRPSSNRRIEMFDSSPLSEVKWKKGQPLGLTPSFPSFTLGHHAVVKYCGGTSQNYRILGDDIIITDDNVARKYMTTMLQLGCPTSPDKTLCSNQVAEFAGKLVTKDWSLPSMKWRNISDTSFLEIAKALGPSVRKILRPRQRRVLDILSDIPDFVGGLGWNSQGSPLETRLRKAELIYSADVEQEPVVDNAAKLDHLRKHMDSLGVNTSRCFLARSTRPRQSTLESVLRSRKISEDKVLKDKLTLLSKDYKVGLSIGDPRGPTTLDVMERRISSNKDALISNQPDLEPTIVQKASKKPTKLSRALPKGRSR